MSMVANQVHKAYSRASHTAPKTQQIVMLYDGAIRFMLQAREAMERGDVELRYRRLVRVGEIVMGLQASIDFETGGGVAPILYDFYSSIDMRILALHQNNDLEQCDSIVADLREMRNVWAAIHDQQSAPAASTGSHAVAASPDVGPVSA